VSPVFAVLRNRTERYDHARPMEEQVEWPAHAAFMDRLADAGFFVLVGPLEGTADVLLIVDAMDEAEITQQLAVDPWAQNGMLRTVWIAPWTLRIGSLQAKTS
jgi:uncharacterized protein YciI